MCGIAVVAGAARSAESVESLVKHLEHRGPDATAVRDLGASVLGHTRLSIIDLSPSGAQPMSTTDGRLWITYNGEVYNFRDLRTELTDFPFRGGSDTESVLAAYERWGDACVDRLHGMFAFCVWDNRHRRLFATRDRFGVKPLYYHWKPEGTLVVASEIRALHALGLAGEPNASAWATYLRDGALDHSSQTFWSGIRRLPPGHSLEWHDGRLRVWRWYDIAERVSDPDLRPIDDVVDEYRELLLDSVRRRLVADVPVGLSLSGGFDSGLVVGLVDHNGGDALETFTFVTGDPSYDELPWARALLRGSAHASHACSLQAEAVPDLAFTLMQEQLEPYGGIPTLGMAKVFEHAAEQGVRVLLDGQGLDEQLAGYDYYQRGEAPGRALQGSRDSPTRPCSLVQEFRSLGEPVAEVAHATSNLVSRQLQDIQRTKLPRALRYNDLVSMRSSTEVRSPFLDHRLVELALRQPDDRKIRDGLGKVLARRAASGLARQSGRTGKQSVQTPQREWLRGELRDWAGDQIREALRVFGGRWLEAKAVERDWSSYCSGAFDNSNFVWQWITLGMLSRLVRPERGEKARLRNEGF